MANHRQEVEEYIEHHLPEKFVSSTISEMYASLQRDMRLLRSKSPGMAQKQMEMILHHRHKKLAFSCVVSCRSGSTRIRTEELAA